MDPSMNKRKRTTPLKEYKETISKPLMRTRNNNIPRAYNNKINDPSHVSKYTSMGP